MVLEPFEIAGREEQEEAEHLEDLLRFGLSIYTSENEGGRT